jgi:hypothetical protein
MLVDIVWNGLKTGVSTNTFLLSTFIIGHKYDGTTEVASECHTTLNLIDVSNDFDGNGGGVLSMEFIESFGNQVAVESPTAPLYKLQGVSSASTVNLRNNLGGLIQALENRLNDQYYAIFKSQYTEDDSGTPTQGRVVQYMINIPEEWESFELDLAKKSTTATQGFLDDKASFGSKVKAKPSPIAQSATPKATDYSFVSFADGTSVVDAVGQCLKSCSKYIQLTTEERLKAGTAQTAKINTNITSDSKSFVVHVDVFIEHIPKLNGADKTSTKSSKLEVPEQNVLFFPHSFTGRNKDVLEYQFGYKNGGLMALMRTAPMATNVDTSRESGQLKSKVAQDGAQKPAQKTDTLDASRPSDPIVPLRSPQHKANNSAASNTDMSKAEKQKASEDKQSQTRALAMLNYLSSMDATLVIRGNPLLMRKLYDRPTRGGVPPHTPLITSSSYKNATRESMSKTLKTSKELYRSSYYTPIINTATKAPVSPDNAPDLNCVGLFVKMDVRVPNIGADGLVKDGGLYTSKLTFDGVYRVIQCRTTIQGGVFRQTFEMIPYMADDVKITEG